MGDILHSLPAITALRAARPRWTIDWVIEPQWRALLAADGTPEPGAPPADHGRATGAPDRCAHRPLVDEIHLAPAKQWARRPLAASTLSAILGLRRAFALRRYDAVIDLQGAIRSAGLARLAGASRVIGEALPREPAAQYFFSERVPTAGVHVIEQSLEVVAALAGDLPALTLPQLPTDAQAAAWCDTLAVSEPFVLLNPGAGWGAKRWPVERYAAVARLLAGRGFAVAVNVGPAEHDVAAAFRTTAGDAVHVVTPSLGRLIELTRRACLAIAGDTGPLHLAAALGLPTVGIFGPTDPARNGPFHGRYRILRHPSSRRDHSRRAAVEPGLLTISPDEVAEAAFDLLNVRALPITDARPGVAPMAGAAPLAPAAEVAAGA